MPVITVEPDLFERIEETAVSQEITVDAIIEEATRRYLWDAERDRISAEMDIYRQRHSELKIRYGGEYIAMHEGEVVDHDVDMNKLWQRIRRRFGRTPVMITLVGESPERTFVRRGFRFEEIEA